MPITVHPATRARFDDMATMVGPKKPTSTVCWCLIHRVEAKVNTELKGAERAEYVRTLCARRIAHGVLACDGNEVVGWAAMAPRSELPFARSRKIPHVDDLPVWSAWCVRVRPGHRGQKVDLTMAYVGTRAMFEQAGFVHAAGTDAVAGGFPRVVMRLDLR